jgi:carbonic anhydrase/acetyltransferase-like protein (isoleucine patch superfamily)
MINRRYQEKEPRIGARVFLAENCALIGDVELGDDCSIWYGAVLRGDIHYIRIGARTNIQDNCVLHVEQGTGPTVVAEEVTIGHAAVVHGCTIGRGALIGIGSKVLSYAVIGEQALVGAGAVIQEGMNVPPRTLAVGVPARVKRDLNREELERLDRSWKYYLEYKNEYLKKLSALSSQLSKTGAES